MNLKAKPYYLDDDGVSWVETTLSRLDDRQKAGQLFCVLGDLYSDDRLTHMIKEQYVGGVLLRPCGIDRLVGRNKEMDDAAAIPILKAANLEEGGDGAVSDGCRFGSQMQVAAAGDVKWASRLGETCAREAELAGINITFSPDSDIDFNFHNPITNTRTYGSDPETVREFATAYMKAVQSFGIAACAKHFPGDGVDFRDQHLHPTINSLSAVIWNQTYGRVYSSLIEGGVKCIMVGHIMQPCIAKTINPTLTDEQMLPASLSPELIKHLLREKLGFNGTVFVDATIMGGFTQRLARRRAIPLAIASGGDMLVFNTNFDEDVGFVLAALEDGSLVRERFEDAVRRVLALKASLGLNRCKRPGVRRSLPVSEWIRKCAERSVTLVKDRDRLLPITAGNTSEVRIVVLGNDATPQGSLCQMVADELQKRGIPSFVFDPKKAEMTGVSGIPAGRLDLYIANYEAQSDRTTVRIFWDGKFALDLPRFIADVRTVFVSFSNPYHLQDVPGVGTFINAYTPTRAVVGAVVAKLCGEQKFMGKSPVDPFCGLLDARL